VSDVGGVADLAGSIGLVWCLANRAGRGVEEVFGFAGFAGSYRFGSRKMVRQHELTSIL